MVAGIFEVTVSTAARIATFGLATPSDVREVDGVLDDVHLVLEGGRDVDGAVGDDAAPWGRSGTSMRNTWLMRRPVRRPVRPWPPPRP